MMWCINKIVHISFYYIYNIPSLFRVFEEKTKHTPRPIRCVLYYISFDYIIHSILQWILQFHPLQNCKHIIHILTSLYVSFFCFCFFDSTIRGYDSMACRYLTQHNIRILQQNNISLDVDIKMINRTISYKRKKKIKQFWSEFSPLRNIKKIEMVQNGQVWENKFYLLFFYLLCSLWQVWDERWWWRWHIAVCVCVRCVCAKLKFKLTLLLFRRKNFLLEIWAIKFYCFFFLHFNILQYGTK